MSEPAIQVDNLVRVYPRRHQEPLRAVNAISFDVPRSTVFGLLGPNGAVKTTTIKILTTILPPTSGTARVMGHDVVREPLEVRQSICAVLQEGAIEVHLSVRNNFRIFGRFHGLTTKETERRAGPVIERFGLSDVLDEKGMDLSGGLKRRVQVAKIFLVDKPVVFLDEATTGMDAVNKRATIAAIREEAARGRTIVLTTHLLDEAEALCSSLAIINHGKIIARGTVDDIRAMSLDLFTVSVETAMSERMIRETTDKFQPVRFTMVGTVVDITVRNEQAAFELLQALRATGLTKGFEVTRASLEDVFLDLIDRKEPS